jgi:2',3'-cyclic-nucleotide 2'-phosphodiesterase (5'-nucleotidase family)
MTRRVQSVVVSGVLLLTLALPAWGGERWSLTILHTNDLHGRLLAFDYGDGEDAPAWPQGYLGGLARRSTAVAELRDEIEHALVLIDTGDVFTRGPWHEKWYGEPEMEAMNLMGYDLLVVGNNELKPIWDDPRSQEMMLSLMRRSRFPWLAANLVIDDDAATGDSPNYVEGIHPFVVRTFGEVRVGFLGLTTPASAEYPHLTEWTAGVQYPHPGEPSGTSDRAGPGGRRGRDRRHRGRPLPLHGSRARVGGLPRRKTGADCAGGRAGGRAGTIRPRV